MLSMKTLLTRMLLGCLLLLLLLGAGWLLWQASAPSPRAAQLPYQLWFTRPGQQAPSQALEKEVCEWLEQAQSQLDIAAFELSLPCLASTLVARQKMGVTVRIVTDSDYLETPVLKALDAVGIPIVADQRSAFMHNKFIIRDHDTVWTGSLNLTSSGIYNNNNNVVAVQHQGLAALYTAEFEEMFLDRLFGPRSPRQDLPALFTLADGTEVEALFSPEDPVRERILDLLKGAQHSIRFLAFAFTDHEIGQVIQDKAQAGLQVQGVYERMGSSSRYSTFGSLKKAGLAVRRDGNSGMMHHKVMILDDTTVITGSYNFSRNADRANDENVLILHQAEIASEYLKEFAQIYAQASE